MKSSAAASKLHSTKNSEKYLISSTNLKTLSQGGLKMRSFANCTKSPQVGKVSCKEKLIGSLENVPKELSNQVGNNQHNKLKVPSIVHDRHSAGSPSILNTPIRLSSRNSDIASRVCTPEIFTTVRFETPRRQASHQPNLDVETSNLVVAVRVRPQTLKEESDKEMKPIIQVSGTEMSVLTEYGQTHSFTYDHCFSSSSTSLINNKQNDQLKVYENLAKPLLSKAFKGFNTCLFAYGQTGSGKSYSIMGHVGSDKDLIDESGIVPRFCFDLFRNISTYKKNSTDHFSVEVQISYFEIYKEKIQDLLCPANKPGGSLRVREHPQNGPYVVDLTKHTVDSFEEIQRWLILGNRHRATATTSANERSSRSHAIFTIILTQCSQEELGGKPHEIRKQSRINFIDLAGSERVASVHAVGDRREEGLTINQSLLTLGRVITALAEQKFVPYRESVLTWLLKESLGGDSKTVMLATVSPCAAHLEETLSTLRYACQARKIVNTARICEDPNTRHIRHLREQIKLLENRLHDANLPLTPEQTVAGSHFQESSTRVLELETEIQSLKTRLGEIENLKDVSWQERVTQAEKRRTEAEIALANSGLSSITDPQQPCLVNVNKDPILSGTLFFPLKLGKNWIGPPTCSSDPPAIQLAGIMIEEDHCCIEYSEDLKLTANAETYVNGQQVSSPVLLRHGDRIIIGGTHYFHLHHPRDCKMNGKQSVTEVPDFETAYEELRLFQEKKLEEAIKDAQEKARMQLLTDMEEFRQEAALEISLQRHSYEDEIASLNRVLQDRHTNHALSPPLSSPSTTKSSWDEIELLIQETQKSLAGPITRSSEESSFMIQSMLNEFNAISRRFQQPFVFSRTDKFTDEPQTSICVLDRDRHLVMHWSVDKARQRLESMRETIEESGCLPINVMFDIGDVWHLEDDASALLAPAIKEKLEKLLKRQDNSINVLDESRFSLDSSRRSSLLPRSPTINTSIAESCQQLILKFTLGNSFSSFFSASCGLHTALAHPELSGSFAISVTCHAVSLLAVYPGLVEHLLNKTSAPSSIRQDLFQTAQELGQRFQKSIEFVIQGITLDSVGLFNEWAQRALNSLEAIVGNVFGLSAFHCNEVPTLNMFSMTCAISGFVSIQKKVHEATIQLGDGIRMKIAQLPDENSIDSNDNSSFMNNGWLVKACHDSVTQVLILLERFTANIGCPDFEEMDLNAVHLQFHKRIDILLRLGDTIEHLFSYLELADLSQVKLCAAALEVQATAYSNLMALSPETLLCDVSFAVGTVHKIVAERRRMTALKRGRDIIYSPLPARLLTTPSRKSSNYDDALESEIEDSSLENSQSEEESFEEFSISTAVIKKALRFKNPTKSSLKSSIPTQNQSTKSVRFDVSDPPFNRATAS